MAQNERILLEWYLEQTDYNVSDAARMLEIDPRTLYRRLEILAIDFHRSDTRGRPRKQNGTK